MSSRREFARLAAGLGAISAAGPLGALAATRPEPPQDPGPWLNVKDFGARGDGETDDAAAIQAAFDARGWGRVYFPAGAYVVGSTLRLRHPLWIQGEATRHTLILSRLTEPAPTIDVGFADFSDALRTLKLGGFTIRGHGPGAGRAGGLRLNAVYDSLVEGVQLQGLGWGLEGNRAISVHFDNLIVVGMRKGGGASGEGVYLYAQSNGCVFNKLRANANEGPAFRFGNGQACTLVAPGFESNTSSAVVVGERQDGRLIECRGFTVISPYFEANRPYDFVLKRGSPFTIIGGYWGPVGDEYIAPFDYHQPFTAIGCNFPRTGRGAVHVQRGGARALFMGCDFKDHVATFSPESNRDTARLRVLDGEREVVVGRDAEGIGDASDAGAPGAGAMRFDAALGRPVWYDGRRWVDAAGEAV